MAVFKWHRMVRGFYTLTTISLEIIKMLKSQSHPGAYGGRSCLETDKYHVCNSTVDYHASITSKYFKILCMHFFSYISKVSNSVCARRMRELG